MAVALPAVEGVGGGRAAPPMPFFFCFIIPAELSSTYYTTTEAPVIAHHAKLGGLRLAPKGPAIQGGAPPIKERKGRGVNWFTYRVAFV